MTKLYLYKEDWSHAPDEEHDLKPKIRNIQVKPNSITIVMDEEDGTRVLTFDVRRIGRK